MRLEVVNMSLEYYMPKKRNIQDMAIRNAIYELEGRLDKIDSIPQVPKTATLEQVIDIINKIISKDKRR